MIDLHCHILPGVDDGSADEEESCAMARLAVESGVTDIAATPHCNAPDPFYNYADSALHARFARLRQRLEREQIPLRIHEGMEVFTTPELPRLLDEGRLLTLGGTRYLLIEFAFGESEWFFDEMLAAVRAGADAGARASGAVYLRAGRAAPAAPLGAGGDRAAGEQGQLFRYVRPPGGRRGALGARRRGPAPDRERRAQSLPADDAHERHL